MHCAMEAKQNFSFIVGLNVLIFNVTKTHGGRDFPFTPFCFRTSRFINKKVGLLYAFVRIQSNFGVRLFPAALTVRGRAAL